eukprot:CAMPEP_0114126940 /NCGR_PEP_ID=MMETSP0043_2-20121206/10095_1 /TAXON_ID=464988 /ORGANISM="Hemiselmis andersenii, Strain CCMP644" /LENGTH=163 /DNA_ID=CAMNT_0001219953 /DNA_START=242 /DNA_END=733 /DNA_ORIENTATION=-
MSCSARLTGGPVPGKSSWLGGALSTTPSSLFLGIIPSASSAFLGGVSTGGRRVGYIVWLKTGCATTAPCLADPRGVRKSKESSLALICVGETEGSTAAAAIAVFLATSCALPLNIRLSTLSGDLFLGAGTPGTSPTPAAMSEKEVRRWSWTPPVMRGWGRSLR